MPFNTLIEQGYLVTLVNDLPTRKQHANIIVYDAEDVGHPLFPPAPDTTMPVAAEYRHIFCGPHEVKGAECPNCRQPMPRLLALDTQDPRLGLTDLPCRLLPLFFCFRCDLCMDALFYRVHADTEIGILSYNKNEAEQPKYGWGQEGTDHWVQPPFYPGTPIALRPLTVDEQRYLRMDWKTDPFSSEWATFLPKEDQIDLYRHRHQIGGQPLLAGNSPDICPECQAPMPFLASICDECLREDGFTGDDFQLLVHFCRTCNIVGMDMYNPM